MTIQLFVLFVVWIAKNASPDIIFLIDFTLQYQQKHNGLI